MAENTVVMLTARVPDQLATDAMKVAQAQGLTRSELIRRMLEKVVREAA